MELLFSKIQYLFCLFYDRQFLRGVEEYGKSNLTDIAKNVVVTKTPAQVASHAQKYFLRQKSGKRTRPSIHDTEPVVAQPHNAELPEHPIQQGLNPPNNIITNDFLANFK